MAQITHKDIAAALSVSRETVTKALSGDPRVADDTRKAVLDKAGALGYMPNLLASSLASRKSSLVGLVLPRIAHPFFSAVAEEFYLECRRRNYTVIPMASFENRQHETECIRLLLSMRVAGMVVCSTCPRGNQEASALLGGRSVPTVFFDPVSCDAELPHVVLDVRTTIFRAVAYALSRGYRRLVFFAPPIASAVGKECERGFLDALEEFGLDNGSSSVVPCGVMREDVCREALRWFGSTRCPDCVLAADERTALGIYDAARVSGIDIPARLGVIGIGVSDCGEMLSPGLTSFGFSAGNVSRAIARLLFDAIAGGKIPSVTVIPGNSALRGSCR